MITLKAEADETQIKSLLIEKSYQEFLTFTDHTRQLLKELVNRQSIMVIFDYLPHKKRN